MAARVMEAVREEILFFDFSTTTGFLRVSFQRFHLRTRRAHSASDEWPAGKKNSKNNNSKS